MSARSASREALFREHGPRNLNVISMWMAQGKFMSTAARGT